MSKISAAMAAALHLAREHHGTLDRYARGQWSYSGAACQGGVPVEAVSEATIKALLKRGEMKVTMWRTEFRINVAVRVAIVDKEPIGGLPECQTNIISPA
ncbi:MAG: hypothetical protein GC190_19150 [Alphaproteobacteria bacterium]|nr:hypothetical protein [Alphaproteobacteria bacterium]